MIILIVYKPKSLLGDFKYPGQLEGGLNVIARFRKGVGEA